MRGGVREDEPKIVRECIKDFFQERFKEAKDIEMWLDGV